MVNYRLRANGVDIPLYIVTTQTWGGGMQLVTYEAPGTNGGVSLTTGRTTNKITLTGRFVAKAGETMLDLEAKKNLIDDIKNEGKPVVLTAPIGNNDTGVYLINSFTGAVEPGQANAIPFQLELTEYRQANLKRTSVNLISYEPAEEFKKILKERQISG